MAATFPEGGNRPDEIMFVDEAEIFVQAGNGGDGAVAFRREKYVPRGGPSGGDGGRGGDVVFVSTHDVNTLADFRHKQHVRAQNGQAGGSKKKSGRNGDDAVIEVPVGTIVHDLSTGEMLADMTVTGQRVVIARGGDGGIGNVHFKSSSNQSPRRATPGKPGEARELHLELKLIADVGLVGFPSVGKSTLIATLSSARPKIADYPFTTLTPNLGVVKWKDFQEFVIADVPGLIEGAHEGHGLGIQFLKHIERTQFIVHVLEVTPKIPDQPAERDPIGDYEVICNELRRFNPELVARPQLAVLNKVDLPFVRDELESLRAYFEEKLGLPFLAVSAATGENIERLKDTLGHAVATGRFDASDDVPSWER